MVVELKKKTNQIKISDAAIIALAGTAVSECYGVVGMSVERISDGINKLLDKENYSKGVIVRNKSKGIEVDLHVVIAYGVKVSEVVNGIQKRVKYSLEKTLNMKVKEVNVFIEGIKEI